MKDLLLLQMEPINLSCKFLPGRASFLHSSYLFLRVLPKSHCMCADITMTSGIFTIAIVSFIDLFGKAFLVYTGSSKPFTF